MFKDSFDKPTLVPRLFKRSIEHGGRRSKVAAEPTVVPLVDAGLGNSAYLVDLGDGSALVVDASRDLRAVRRAAQRRGLRLAFAADTHLHADFLSGAVQLAATDGATALASAAGRREFAHTALGDGDEVDLGGLRLRALTTPGHTDEHLAFLLLDGDRPVGVFTGGCLLVGAAARTDLVDPDRTEELARAQYRSLHRLLTLPDEVGVWPTHGAGSFCSAPPGADRTSSIGREKATNPLLQAADEDAFVAQLLGSLGSFPPYFLRLAEVNRRGLAVLGGPPSLDPVSPAAASRLLRGGAVLVDVRPVVEYAAGHVPGSLCIPLRDAFATWLGWLTPHEGPLLVLRSTGQDPDEVAWQAVKIGYENLVGELAGGIAAWTAAGLPVTATRLVGPQTVVGPEALDVRQAAEFASGHLPGARHIELGALPDHAADLPGHPVVVMCSHGERAATGASVLERAGRDDVSVLVGGPDDWAAAHGLRPETGG
jgi:rhodanese-related sulfurtransferase/glyoxylase-like metal-dependent hydrolase (beta-lactamase superfamily II)